MAKTSIFLLTALLTLLMLPATAQPVHRQYTASDGLPTDEVQQIVELPNGQMLANCEGEFCLFNGRNFMPVPSDYSRGLPLKRFGNRYAHLWQGDSLLWLRDLYRIHLFDTRTRTFRYDIAHRVTGDALRRFASGETQPQLLPPELWQQLASMGIRAKITTAATDRQGGVWVGTMGEGIVYISPHVPAVQVVEGDTEWMRQARSTTDSKGRQWQCGNDGLACDDHGVTSHFDTGNLPGLRHNHTTFIAELSDGRFLLCYDLNKLGYFRPEQHEFAPACANSKKGRDIFDRHRYMVGACPLTERWTLVYTQNGAFLLDTKADTVAPFPPEKAIGRYSVKYNCLLRDHQGQLWMGTQNGLFVADGTAAQPPAAATPATPSVRRIAGLANNCIRSLALDASGNVWAGTACGLSRVTPTVVNLSEWDGIPAGSMTERAACATGDNRLVFVRANEAIVFRPDQMVRGEATPRLVATAIAVNDRSVSPATRGLSLPHDQNYLSFQVSSLNYARPSHTRYRYRLNGLESDWHTANDGSGLAEATYTAVPPGHYTLEAQAATPDGTWGHPLLLPVDIRPPLWLTWWAKTLYALAAAAILALMVAIYVRRKRARLVRENDQRVNQLFELREEARHQFAQSVNIDPKRIAVNSEEERLVEKLLTAIERNMSNADYNVELLARDVALSRTSLYDRMRNMLGITPSDFMRSVRLKRAARLLAETQLPVADVATQVGFNTPRIFSTHFKRMFGVLPSQYQRH